MDQMNYHHLRYFREVAHEGHLGRAAEKLNVSQSALSIQIKQLEERLGYAFFDRVGRSLKLTEAGAIALDYADRIFSTGAELTATLARNSDSNPPLRVGALSTLSRNFQLQFLRPVLGQCEVQLRSGNVDTLFSELHELRLDVVLTTELPKADVDAEFAAKRISEQAVGLHGKPRMMDHSSLAEMLREEPVILPTESVIRAGFEDLVTRLGVRPTIAAGVDDMAMVRLLAREGAGLAVAPAVVLSDEIAQGSLATAPFDLEIFEPFYAVTKTRLFPHPVLAHLL